MKPANSATQSAFERDAILTHLAEILSDRRFAASDRNARFLRYVVERTLDGKADEIKETVIATEVYGRAGDYDPKSDSIVRVEATRIRQKLRSFYETYSGAATVRIVIPSGTYVPRFETAPESSTVPEPTPLPSPQVVEHSPSATYNPVQAAERSRLAWAGIAAAVAVALFLQGARASRIPGTPHPEAAAAVQEATTLLEQDPHLAQTERGTPATLSRAIERLEFAVAKDSSYARGWAKLAEAYDYAFAYAGRDPAEDARRAESAARRAIALDPELGAGHHMLGLVQWLMKWNFTAAEASYRRALELEPNNVYAAVEYTDLLRETGRSERAADLIRKTRALQPGLPQLAVKESELHLELGRIDAAKAAAEEAIQLKRNYLRAYVALGSAHELSGNTEAALSRYEHVLGVNPTDRRALPAYGYLLARTGQTDRAREIIGRLEQMNGSVRNCAFQIAVVYAGLRDNDRALEWLQRAWRTHQTHFPFVVVEHRFDDLRKDPRFQQLMRAARLHSTT